MLIPLGTERSRKRPSVVTPAIMVACLLVYVAQVAAARGGGQEHSFGVLDQFILDPTMGRWWTLLTSVFMHADVLHLAGNMLFLWVFGPSVEDKFGRVWYLLFYLTAGIASGGAHLAMQGGPALGASGAVSGVTGAFLVLFPWTHVRVLVFFFMIGVFSIPSWWLIGFAIVRDFLGIGIAASGIAHWAHLGGYGFGMLLSMVLLWTKALPREPYDLFTISRQAKRRAAMREAHRIHEQRVAKAVRPKRAGRATAPIVAAPEPDPVFPPAVRAARARVADHLSSMDTEAAASAYKRLLNEHLAVPGAVLMGRTQQLTLGNALYAAGDHQTAARAYEAFLDAYPHDREAPSVRVMLGLINARFLNDPVRAKALLGEAVDQVRGEQRELAEELLAELG